MCWHSAASASPSPCSGARQRNADPRLSHTGRKASVARELQADIMQDSFTQSHAEQSVMQLIVDQLEELVVTIIEEIRQRPGVAAAILAVLLGAIGGSMRAARLSRRANRP